MSTVALCPTCRMRPPRKDKFGLHFRLSGVSVKRQVRCANLPLAVYREVAAHLAQVDGVTVELVPQRSTQFDYSLSQIDSLRIHYADAPQAASEQADQQVRRVLAYYGDRYGAWETIESTRP